MSGGAIAADASNNLYFITGNGTFDASSSSAPNNDYGDSFLKLTSGLSVAQYFTPSDQATDFTNDADFGAGGAAVLVDIPENGTNPTQLVIGGGKDGTLYVLNRNSMGGLGDQQCVAKDQPGEWHLFDRRFLELQFLHRRYQGQSGGLRAQCEHCQAKPVDNSFRRLRLPGSDTVGIVDAQQFEWDCLGTEYQRVLHVTVAGYAAPRCCTRSMPPTWARSFGTAPRAPETRLDMR